MKRQLPARHIFTLLILLASAGCGAGVSLAPPCYTTDAVPVLLEGTALTYELGELQTPPTDAKTLGETPQLLQIRHRQLLETARRLAPLTQRLGEPGYDDWRSTWRETRQSLAEYMAGGPPCADDVRRVIYLQPVGELLSADQQVLPELSAFLEAFFGCPVRLRDAILSDRIPPEQRRKQTDGEQWLAPFILDNLLLPERPADAACVLGITSADIYRGSAYDYMFGQAALRSRVGVISLHRLRTEDAALLRRRVWTLAAHEMLHMFGVTHTPDVRCLMNGCSRLRHLDQTPLWCSPEVLAKLLWATGAEPAPRFNRLENLYDKYGMATERDYCRLATGLLDTPAPEPSTPEETSRRKTTSAPPLSPTPAASTKPAEPATAAEPETVEGEPDHADGVVE